MRYSHLLNNIVDEDEYHQSEAREAMARTDRVPTHADEYACDSQDPGDDDAAIDELSRRLDRAARGNNLTVNVTAFFDVLYGYLYDDYGPQPNGNPVVLDPARRMVVFTDDFLVLRRPARLESDAITGLRQSNGRYSEYGRLYRISNIAWI